MRLRRLDLTRYGKFTDKVLDFGEKPASGPDFHLVYGLNEAGKSTAFDGYLSLLFGIEARSVYNFLHDYKAMLVGGCLETDGRVLDVLRTKGNANDLRTASGDLLPASALGQTLGGLTRDAYRAMFSLNDSSLEEGGKAIVESKGELGQLLFAASSGLSQIARELGLIRDTADTLFKPNSRSTQMRELLDRLGQLKVQMSALDVAASRYDEMKQDAEKTRLAHEIAQNEYNVADKARRKLQRLSAAWPLAAKYRARQAEALPLAHLPLPPPGWSEDADQIVSDEAAHESQQRSNAALILRLEGELHDLALDDALLNAAGQIAALDLSRSRYATADLDLPKRIASLATEQAAVVACLASLGEPATTEPASLLLNERITARLTELASTEPTLAGALTLAEAEVTDAAQKLEQAEAGKERGHSAVTDIPALASGSQDITALQDLLARLTGDNSTGTLTQQRDDVRADAEKLSVLVKALLPFVGDVDALAALVVPSLAQVERQAADIKVAEADLRLASTRLAEHQEQVARQTARAMTLSQQAGLVDDQAMTSLGDARDAAWRVHVDALGAVTSTRDLLASSAASYSLAAVAERTALTGNMRQAEKWGEWRAASLGQAETAAVLAVVTAARDTAARTLNDRRSQLDVALIASRLPSGWHADEFARWLKCRAEVLALAETLARKQARSRELEALITQDTAALTRELAALSIAAPAGSALPQLLGLAQRALTTAATAWEKREGDERALAKLRHDLAERKTRSGKARLALETWQQGWALALRDTWLMRGPADHSASTPSVAEVRAVLDVLVRLGQRLEIKANLDRQIDTMRTDQSAFTVALQSACTASGQPFDVARPMDFAVALEQALVGERKRQALRQSKAADLDRAQAERQSISDAVAELGVRRGRMLTHFKVADTASLRQALQQASHAMALSREIAGLETDITTTLRVADLATALEEVATVDADSIEAELARLEQTQQVANTQLQELNHARRLAEAALAAVGADEKTARLREDQRTIGLEIEDTGLRYLRLRIGINAVETALRTYRDQHRSSMLKDAAIRFKSLTAGNFTDLQTQPTDKGESLLGVQSTGRSILADAMSEGTRDQLFLALRMAGYMEFVKTREALPFVADDIMETFDNERAAATFAMFQEVAHHGQVIYLTHHEHLCDIARSVCGDAVRITQL